MDQLPELALAGFSVIFLTASTTQALKEWTGLEGKAGTALAFGVGVVYAGLATAQAQGLLDSVAPVVEVVVTGIVFGLNAAGFYKLAGVLAGKR
jgi:hypothetical protein